MSGVRGVLNYAGCFAEAPGSVVRVNGWEAVLCDGLAAFKLHLQLSQDSLLL